MKKELRVKVKKIISKRSVINMLISMFLVFLSVSPGFTVEQNISTIWMPGTPYLAQSGSNKRPVAFSQGSDILGYNDAELNRVLNEIVATGATYLRVDFAWGYTEETRGNFNWSITDRVVNAAVGKGLKIIALTTTSPLWAAPDWDYPPNNPAEFQNFCYLAGRRYIPKGVVDWEIWNEANLQHMDGPAYTSKVLKPGSTGVRRAATELGRTVNIITSGLSPDGKQNAFLRAIYSNGGKSFFDNVAYHPYCNNANAADPNGNFMKMQELYNIMSSNGDGAKKIWVTEFGMTTGGPFSWTEQEQAAFIPQAYNIWNGWSWSGPFCIYSYRENGTDPNNREHHFGMVHENWSPKPALQAVKNMIARQNNVSYYTVRNRQRGTYLNDDGSGQLKYSSSSTGARSQWVIETSEGNYVRLKNRQTGNYLHVENNFGYVQTGPLGSPDWWSAQWLLEDYNGYKRINNRWQFNQYIHLQNLRGYAESTAITQSWQSAQWTVQQTQ